MPPSLAWLLATTEGTRPGDNVRCCARRRSRITTTITIITILIRTSFNTDLTNPRWRKVNLLCPWLSSCPQPGRMHRADDSSPSLRTPSPTYTHTNMTELTHARDNLQIHSALLCQSSPRPQPMLCHVRQICVRLFARATRARAAASNFSRAVATQEK